MSRRTLSILAPGFVAALALMGPFAASSRAAFTVSLNSITPSGPNSVFNYSAAITQTDMIQTGDFFRIYDFSGFVSATAPTGWTVTAALTNPTPPPNVILTEGDSDSIINLIFTYTGAATITGPAVLTGFNVTSIYSLTTTKNFVGRASQATDLVGSDVDSIGVVPVAAVPEPASVALLGLGALGLVGLGRRRLASR